MEFTSFDQLNELITRALWQMSVMIALLVGCLSVVVIAGCLGGALGQCVLEARDALRRHRSRSTARSTAIRPALSTPALRFANPQEEV